jgi:hypothetical protein
MKRSLPKTKRPSPKGLAAMVVISGVMVAAMVGMVAINKLATSESRIARRNTASVVVNRSNFMGTDYFSEMLRLGAIVPFRTPAAGTLGAGVFWINFGHNTSNNTIPPTTLNNYAFQEGFCPITGGSTADCCPGGAANCTTKFAIQLCSPYNSAPVNFESLFTGGALPSATDCATRVTPLTVINSYDAGTGTPTSRQAQVVSTVTGTLLKSLSTGTSSPQSFRDVATVTAPLIPGASDTTAPSPNCAISPTLSMVSPGASEPLSVDLSLTQPAPFIAIGTPGNALPGPVIDNSLGGWISQITHGATTVNNPNPASNPFATVLFSPNDSTSNYTYQATVRGPGGISSCSATVYTRPSCHIALSPSSGQLSGGSVCTDASFVIDSPQHPTSDQVTQGKITANGVTNPYAISGVAGTNIPSPGWRICYSAVGSYQVTGAVNSPLNAADFTTFPCTPATFTATDPPPAGTPTSRVRVSYKDILPWSVVCRPNDPGHRECAPARMAPPNNGRDANHRCNCGTPGGASEVDISGISANSVYYDGANNHIYSGADQTLTIQAKGIGGLANPREMIVTVNGVEVFSRTLHNGQSQTFTVATKKNDEINTRIRPHNSSINGCVPGLNPKDYHGIFQGCYIQRNSLYCDANDNCTPNANPGGWIYQYGTYSHTAVFAF